MSKSVKTEFYLEGRFLGYEFKDGYKIKRLSLATENGEFSIKMTKEARMSIGRTLLPGDPIRVVGTQKRDLETFDLKLKAYWIQPLAQPAQVSSEDIAQLETAMQPATKPQPKASILVCQKSTCMKKGGKEICHALDATLAERGLDEQVKVKGTGCMKACGKGPNVVFMPGKVRYTRISAKDIPALVDEHFAAAQQPVPAPAEVEVEVEAPVELIGA